MKIPSYDDSAQSVKVQTFGAYSHPSDEHICLKLFETCYNQGLSSPDRRFVLEALSPEQPLVVDLALEVPW